MAARKRKVRHDENTREKIRASQLINRLTNHVLGEVEMTSTQVTAALGLLRKTLPDLQATTLDGELTTNQNVISAEPEPVGEDAEDAWAAKQRLQ